MKRILAFALLLFPAFAGVAGAQTATLVRDINPGSYVPIEGVEAPRQLTPVAGGAVFFTLSPDPYPMAALWFTDGTAAGTRFVMAFCVDASCSHTPQIAATLPGLAFFYAESGSDPFTHPRLWRTDGTLAGTFPLTPILSEFSYTNGKPDFAVAGNRILLDLCVSQGVQDCRLWRSDGTVAGTAPFSEAAGGNFVNVGGQIYFLGGRNNQEQGLWRTDGTNRGTRLVKALNPAHSSWSLTLSGSRLFFLRGFFSSEVWTSDGTGPGTRLVKTFFESDHEFIPRVTTYLKPVGNGKVVFTGLRDTSQPNLWLTDGTPSGTVRLTDAPRNAVHWTPREDQIATAGKRIVFIAGSRLWASGGSPATTNVLGRCPEGCPEVPSESSLVPVGNRLLFAGKDDAHGTDLWVSDGTGPGTRLLADLCPGPCDSKPDAFTSLGGLLWLRATTRNDDTPRLVRTDGTGPGTVVLAPVTVLSPELDLALSGGRVFFAGLDRQYGSQPWVTDGTRAGTHRVTSLPGRGGSSDPQEFTAFEDRLFFTADDGTGTSLWMTDGTGATPIPGTEVSPGTSVPSNLTAAAGIIFYLVETDLWRTDGTAAGTCRQISFGDRPVSDLRELGGRLVFFVGSPPDLWTSNDTFSGPAIIVDLPDEITKVSDVAVLGLDLYFAAETGTRTQIFRSDGTPAGTRVILEMPCIHCTAPSSPLSYARVGNDVYFTAYTKGQGFSGPALFRTNGTAEGTVRVLPAPDRTGGLRVFFPDYLFSFGGDLYFFANVAGNATNKVVFRGRDEASAVRLSSWGNEPFKPFTAEWTPVGNTLYFRAWDIDHGMELWKTDGTPEGTVVVKDILPGLASSDPRDLTAAGNLLYFSARDAAHGRELWVTDGTAAGTRLVQDLFPGGLSSDPEQLTRVGGRLYFTADEVRGREPWSLVASP